MEKIIKIQSESDIITNSSSEVFIMPTESAHSIDASYESYGCIRCQEIYPELLSSWYLDDICDALGIDVYAKTGKDYWDLSEKEIKDFIQSIMPKFLEVFGEDGAYSYVDIEDHFEDCNDAYNDAHAVCIWSDYRH